MSTHRSAPPSTLRHLSAHPIAAALCLALCGGPAQAALITVDTEMDGSIPSHCTLRDALAAANTDATVGGCAAGSGPDVITFAPGVQSIQLTSTAGGTLTVSDALTIDGQGVLCSITRSADDDAFRILNSTTGTPLTARWMKISGGLADVQTPDRGGAGILAWGPLTLSNSEISGNLTSPQYGRGGGINAHDTLTLVDSLVTGNATTGQDARGGGVYAYGDAVITSSTISNNATAGVVAFGGGIASYFSSALDLTMSTITQNSTFGDGSFGGGVFVYGSLTLHDSTISANQTTGSYACGGGGYANTLTAIGSTISGNSTAAYGAQGGGFFVASATLSNATISDNTTMGENAEGGGLLVGYSLQSTNSTIAGNTAERADGGGIYVFTFSAIPMAIDSSLLFGNVGAQHGDLAFLSQDASLVISGQHNLIGDAGTNVQVPTDTLDCDPLLKPLAANGGTTRTRALGDGSCAIDTGSNSGNFAFDQRGTPFVRVFGLAPDIGAIEEQPMPDYVFADGFEFPMFR